MAGALVLALEREPAACTELCGCALEACRLLINNPPCLQTSNRHFDLLEASTNISLFMPAFVHEVNLQCLTDPEG